MGLGLGPKGSIACSERVEGEAGDQQGGCDEEGQETDEEQEREHSVARE
jgi:hypothetical protein